MKNIVQPAGQTEGNAKNKGERAAEHETKVFQVLKEIGVELSSYHGGSLHGKDIKKVMNNASHIFDQFAVIFQEGRGRIVCCQMTGENVYAFLGGLCFVGWSIFVGTKVCSN